MKLKLLSVVLVLMLAFGPISITIQAQSNNTLEWGVEVGEEFTYVLQRAFYLNPSYEDTVAVDFPFIEQMEVGQKVVLNVESLDTIPEMINESSQMPGSICSMVRTNDSVTLNANIQNFVLPIGDWDFLNEMVNLTGFSGVTLIDTEEEWGTKGAASFRAGDGSVVTVSLEIRYEKENGTLNYIRERYSTVGTDLIDIIFVNWHPGMPTIVSSGLQMETILIITIGAVVGFIISVLVYVGYKKQKPVVQKLGE